MAERERLLVTGAAGFIGAEIARDFAARGWEVLGLVRREPPDAIPGVRWVPYALEEAPAPGAFVGARALVHCAYAPGDLALNVAAAERLLLASRSAGVRRNVFVSSLSARDDAPSAYGRQKAAVERLFAGPADTVVRAGLVMGGGGLFGAMRDHVRRRRPIPLVDGGRQPVQTVALGDLVRAIATIVERDLSGLFVVAHPEAMPYRELHAALAARLGIAPRFVPVPFQLVNAALFLAEAIGLELPVRRDSLLGLRAMSRVDPRPHLARLGLSPKSFAEALEQLPP